MPKMKLAFLLLVLSSGCDGTTDDGAPTDDQNQRATKKLPKEIHWMRNSAEHKAATIQAYAVATTKVRAHADEVGDNPKPWAVILDADETVLDNSEFHRRKAVGEKTNFNDWIREEAAPAIPGAVAFTQAVKDLGGHVAIVTNRHVSTCKPTRSNMEKVELAVDAVFCKSTEKDKISRFNAIANGTAGQKLPKLEVIMFVGDNILDFPDLDQEVRNEDESAFADFGERFVLIPNPMYGSWEKNPAE